MKPLDERLLSAIYDKNGEPYHDATSTKEVAQALWGVLSAMHVKTLFPGGHEERLRLFDEGCSIARKQLEVESAAGETAEDDLRREVNDFLAKRRRT